MTSNTSINFGDNNTMFMNETYTVNVNGLEESFDTLEDSCVFDKLGMESSNDTRSISDFSNFNTLSSGSPIVNVNDECCSELSTSEFFFHKKSNSSDALDYLKESYYQLKTVSKDMFIRLQYTAVFLDRLSFFLQGQTDPVLQGLADQIQELNFNFMLSNAEEACVAAECPKKSATVPIENKTTQSSIDILGNQSLSSMVTAEATVIKTEVIKLQQQLADVTLQLNKATAELALKDEIIANWRQNVNNWADRLEKMNINVERLEKLSDRREKSQADIGQELQHSSYELVARFEAAIENIEYMRAVQDTQEAKINCLEKNLRQTKKELTVFQNMLETTQRSTEKQTQSTVNVNEQMATDSAQCDVDLAMKHISLQFDGSERISTLGCNEIEMMTTKCNQYEAYLKDLVQMSFELNENLQPPEFIDPSIHEILVHLILATKQVDLKLQSIDNDKCHINETSIVVNSSPVELKEPKILDRVSKSKDLSNQLVQLLKMLSKEPERFNALVPQMLQLSRDNRETFFLVETHLKSFKDAVTPVNNRISGIIMNEAEDIYNVLRNVQNRQSFAKHHRIIAKPGEK